MNYQSYQNNITPMHTGGVNPQSHSQKTSPNIRGSSKFMPRRNQPPNHGMPPDLSSNIIKIHRNDQPGAQLTSGANVGGR